MHTLSILLAAAATLSWTEAFAIDRDNLKRASCDRDEALAIVGKPADEAASFCYSYMAATITYTTTVGITQGVVKVVTPVPWTVDTTTTITVQPPWWEEYPSPTATAAAQLQERDILEKKDYEPALTTAKETGASATSSACGCLITVEPTVVTKTVWGTITVSSITTLPAWTVTYVKTVTVPPVAWARATIPSI